MPKAELELSLTYSGPEVDDGTMSLDDLVPVLQGVASGYGKVAARQGIIGQHKLRLTAIRPGSAQLILDVLSMVAQHPSAIDSATHIVEAAMSVLGMIIAVIKLKKHVQKKPYSTKIDAVSGQISVVNFAQVSITTNVQIYNLFKEGTLDPDLAKIAKPLEAGKVTSGTVEAIAAEQKLSATIDESEKALFEVSEEAVTSTKEAWLVGQINQMTKTSNSGFIHLSDGTRVYFKLAMDRPESVYPLFGHSGPLNIKCIAQLDENLKPVRLDVLEIVPLQKELFESPQ